MVSSDFHIHPEYDNKMITKYNLCLVKLANPLEFSSTIAAVKLPTYDQTYDSFKSKTFINKTGRISGFSTRESTSLSWGEVKIIEKEKCFADEFRIKTVVVSFCVQGNDDMPYNVFCRGEKGLPLVVEDDNGDWMQIGIAVGHGGARCWKDAHNIYQDILPFLDFINNTMVNNTL